jgi:hypothetical protein
MGRTPHRYHLRRLSPAEAGTALGLTAVLRLLSSKLRMTWFNARAGAAPISRRGLGAVTQRDVEHHRGTLTT